MRADRVPQEISTINWWCAPGNALRLAEAFLCLPESSETGDRPSSLLDFLIGKGKHMYMRTAYVVRRVSDEVMSVEELVGSADCSDDLLSVAAETGCAALASTSSPHSNQFLRPSASCGVDGRRMATWRRHMNTCNIGSAPPSTP